MPKKKETEETKELKEQEVQSEPETAPESGIQSESEQIPEPETQPEPKQASEPETQPEQEKVQFRVQIKDKKVALRTSPEFKIDNSNLFGIADQEGTRLFDILEVKNGYGRVAYPAGTWISLDACIKY
mgnify:FL=1|nr:MAG TPA: PR-1 protein fever, LIPID BINDING PROTEIN [Caudoviricetes sp.]